MTLQYTFPKSVRIHSSREIGKVFEQGVYQSLGPFGAKFLTTNEAQSRFLIAVKKKVGNAPYRNHVKRLLREAIRQERFGLKLQFDVCFFVTRTPQRPLEFVYVHRQVRRLFKQLNSLSAFPSGK